MPNITNLGYSDTFKQWFDTTNTVISTVNGITVHNLVAGDGIGVTSSGNLFTVSHGTAVTTGVTFSGNVKFNGTVEFASSPTISSMVVSVSPKISGITAGNVVRIDGSGLTLARANTQINSEVLGMVVGENTSSNIIALSGSINDTTFSATIANALGITGGTLIAGQAYFLNPDVAGGITINEPQIYGQVSKPVILGISGSLGSLVSYRGIQIEGISAGITAELDNKIIVEVDYSNPVLGTSGNSLKVGDPFFYISDVDIDYALSYLMLNTGFYKINGKMNGSDYSIAYVPDFSMTPWILPWNSGFLGLISKIISHIGSVYVLEITLPGGSFNAVISELDSAWFTYTSKTAGLFLKSDYSGLEPRSADMMVNTSKFADFIKLNDVANTAKIILSPKTTAEFTEARAAVRSLSVNGLTASVEYDNLIQNGAFAIWQRQTTSLTAGSLNDYSTPFADRWFAVQYAATGLTATLSRTEFVSNQVSVPGSPLYYIDISTQHSAASKNLRPRLENIQKEARLLQEQQVAVSFWAKSTVSGVTVDIVYNRYKDSYANTAAVEAALNDRVLISSTPGITLSTVWSEYTYTFTPTVSGFTLSSTESGWFSFGFEFPSNSATISLAQVQLEAGDNVSEAIYVSPERELERCSPYYLRTYDWNQTNGSVETSRLNEETLQLGNLITQIDYAIKFPIELHSDNPTVTLYSPNSGQAGDAFNINTGMDMRYSGDGLVNLPWDSTTARTTSAWPSSNISVSSVSKNGMHVHISNGATHLDTLKFHYVADADLDLNV